jgi:hypothetical protein
MALKVRYQFNTILKNQGKVIVSFASEKNFLMLKKLTIRKGLMMHHLL